MFGAFALGIAALQCCSLAAAQTCPDRWPCLRGNVRDGDCETLDKTLRGTKFTCQAEGTCEGQVDLAFLIDASGSVTQANFNKQLDFVKEVVTKFDIGKDKTRVSVSTYDTAFTLSFGLDTYVCALRHAQLAGTHPLLRGFCAPRCAP